MKSVLIASALFPPDVGEVATYTKELAERLKHEHVVTVLAYGRLLEEVSGATLYAIDKRKILPTRLTAFFFTLMQLLPKHDALFIENGPSVELPATIASFILRKPLVIHVGDVDAELHSKKHWLRRIIQRLAYAKATQILRDAPNPKPEILPLEPYPEEAFTTYEESWKKHMETIRGILKNNE